MTDYPKLISWLIKERITPYRAFPLEKISSQRQQKFFERLEVNPGR